MLIRLLCNLEHNSDFVHFVNCSLHSGHLRLFWKCLGCSSWPLIARKCCWTLCLLCWKFALEILFWLLHCFKNWENSRTTFWKLFYLVKLQVVSFNWIYNLPGNSFSTVRGEFLKLPCFSGICMRNFWLWSQSVWSYPALFCMIFVSFEPVLNKLLIDILCWICGAVFDFLEVKNLL